MLGEAAKEIGKGNDQTSVVALQRLRPGNMRRAGRKKGGWLEICLSDIDRNENLRSTKQVDSEAD
jgi:hypothetical protein